MAETATKKAATKKAVTKKTEDKIVTIAHEVENMTKDAAFTAAAALEDDIEFSYFRLGGILSRIHTEQWYTEEGFEKFPEFVEDRFGIKRSKAFHLIGIYNGLIETNVPWEDVKDLGWSKLKELVHVINPKNVKGWVKRAKEMSVIQLIAYIKKSQASESGEGSEADEADAKKVSSMTFKVHEDQKELINSALEKAKTEASTEFPAVALEAIAMNYLSGPSKPVKKGKDEKAEESPAVDMKDKAVLKEAMSNHTWEDVLAVFEEIWPDVDLMVETE
jgi:hypothetical protein